VALRQIELGRAAWGTALTVAPQHMLRRTGGDPSDPTAVLVMRTLGARQATQAVLSGLSPTSSVLALGVWVDTAHALSAVGFAAMRRRYARPALTDALVAAAWAAAGLRDLRAGNRGEDDGLRSRLSRRVLGVVPGGRLLLRQG
jgi:hypothetical protein